MLKKIGDRSIQFLHIPCKIKVQQNDELKVEILVFNSFVIGFLSFLLPVAQPREGIGCWQVRRHLFGKTFTMLTPVGSHLINLDFSITPLGDTGEETAPLRFEFSP